MAFKKEFERKLDNLWRCRTANLRSLVFRQKAKANAFSKDFREKHIYDLQEIATQIFLRRRAQREFRQVISSTKRNRISRIESDGLDQILSWAGQQGEQPTIYSFWRGIKCLYVGKADNFKVRLGHYVRARSRYLSSGVTIKIHSIKNRSQLAKSECLAIHLYAPINNKVKAAHQMWGKSCPACEIHDHIKEDLQSLFRIK